jgi:transcriptional regulator with XRE-family HTH domain
VPEDEQSFPESLGEIVRRQRELSELSMRQFAALAGISNPYLSQIERGLREPSEHVAEAIAKVLQTSVSALYKEAGIDEEQPESAVADAVAADPDLTPRQRQALLTTYDAFVRANGGPRRRRRPRRGADEPPAGGPEPPAADQEGSG